MLVPWRVIVSFSNGLVKNHHPPVSSAVNSEAPEMVPRIPQELWLGRWVWYSPYIFLLSQWPTFKLFGITCLVGKRKFKLLFHGLSAE